MAGISASDILYIVPGPQDMFHTLYLKDGTVVVFNPHNGVVVSVVELPPLQAIQAKKRPPVATS